MRSNIDILSRSWDALSSKWLLAIGLCLLHTLVGCAVGTFGFGLGALLVGGALSFGFNRTMVQIYRGERPALETYFDGFRHFLLFLFREERFVRTLMSVFDESQSGMVPFWLKDTQSKTFLF